MELKIVSPDCSVIFDDVLVRADETSKLEVHIDTDEGNACNLDAATEVMLRKASCGCQASQHPQVVRSRSPKETIFPLTKGSF